MTETEASPRRRPSMLDVAETAGVSKAAVSKVIRNAYGVSPAMRERVEAAIRELGYRPSIAARSMRGASFTLGFEIPQLANDFFTQVMQGAADELAGSGYQLFVAPAVGDVQGAPVLQALRDRRVDGIVAISPDAAPEWLEQLGAEVPLVLLGRHDPSRSYDTVTSDDAAGARLAMAHLIELGHRDIAHLTVDASPQVPEELLPHTRRLHAYTEAMRQIGAQACVVSGGPLELQARDAAWELLSGPGRPTAVFAANDTLAIGTLRARAELGLNADELSVVGYDNIDLASHPLISLTTVDQRGHETGAIATRLLLDRIRTGRAEAHHEVIAPALRVRGSTRPPEEQQPG